MMYCANCGEKLIDQAVTCPSCGNEIRQEESKNADRSMQSGAVESSFPVVPPTAPQPGRLLSDQSKRMILVVMAAAALIFLIFKFTGGAGSQSSPEKTVKSFMNAVKKENAKAMVSYISTSSMNEGDRDILVEMFEEQFEEGELNLQDYTIQDVEIDEDTATVEYKVFYMEDGEKETEEESFELIKEEGKWFIDEEF